MAALLLEDGTIGYELEDGTSHLELESDYAHEVMSDGATVYWRMDESSGNPIDKIGGKVAGVAGSPTYSVVGPVVSEPSNLAVGTGTSNYFTAADHADFDRGDGPFSVEFWVKRGDAGAGSQSVFDKDTQGGFYFTGSQLHMHNVDFNVIRESGSTTDTDWHHWVVTRSGTGAGNTKLYKDGIDVTVDITTTAVTSSNAIAVGIGATASDTNFFTGSIDEVAWYPSVLTLAQVRDHYLAAIRVTYRNKFLQLLAH